MDRFLIAVTIAAAVAIGAIVIFDLDISAARYFRNDVVVRDAWPSKEIARPIYSDTCAWNLWVPSDWFVWDSLRGGRLPVWDRLQGGGYSPVISIQNGVFHPLRWLVAAVPRNASASVLIVLMVYASLMGSWICFRHELGASSAGATAGALIYTLSGAVVSCVQWSGDALPLAHLPWVVFFTLRACRRRTIGGFVALAFTMALLLLSGHPTHIGIIVALAIALAASSLRNVMTVAASVAGALFLTAFNFLPIAMAAPNLWAYKVETYQGSSYLLYPMDQWRKALLAIVWNLHGGQFIDVNTFYLYVGPAALVLVIAGVYAALQRPRGALLIFTTLGFAMLMLPGPWMAPLAELRLVYWTNRWYYSGAVAFLVAAFAAWGFDLLRQRWRWAAYAIVTVVAVQYGVRMERVLAPQRWQPLVGGEAVRFLRGERVTGFVGLAHHPNASRITGIEDIRSQSPIFTRQTEQFWNAIDPKHRKWDFPTVHLTDQVDSDLLREFGVRYVVESRMPQDQIPSHIRELPVVWSAPSVNIRRIPGNIQPRACFVGSPGEVSVSYPDDQHVVLTTSSPTGGLVILHDTFEDGWRARVDGREASVLPVRILARGIAVPAGRHRVELEYVLPGLKAGAVVSLLSALALIGLKYAADRAR